MATNLGNELKRRREMFGFDVHGISQLTRLSPERVTELETADAEPTILELERFGRALVFDPAQLFAEESLSDPRKLAGWFLSHAGEDQDTSIHAETLRTILLAREVGRIGGFLLRQLESREPRIWESANCADVGPDPQTEGREMGAAARNKLSNASVPLASVRQLLEDHDVHVVLVSLPRLQKKAMTIAERGQMPVVLVNTAEEDGRAILRRRMVLAHEIGHLLHDAGERCMGGTPDLRTSEVEVRARNFAPSFLAPRSSLHLGRFDGDLRAFVQDVSATWGMSLTAALYHALNLKFCRRDDMEALQDDFGWRKVVNQSLDSVKFEDTREPPLASERGLRCRPHELVHGKFQTLVLRSLDAGVISRGRAEEILELR